MAAAGWAEKVAAVTGTAGMVKARWAEVASQAVAGNMVVGAAVSWVIGGRESAPERRETAKEKVRLEVVALMVAVAEERVRMEATGAEMR